MIKSRLLLLLSFFLISACAKKLPELPPSEYLFPEARYKQKVSIILPSGKKQSFTAYLKNSEQDFVLVGLSPFNTSLFRIQGIKGKKPSLSLETYDSKVEEHREKILEFARSFSPILNWKKSQKPNFRHHHLVRNSNDKLALPQVLWINSKTSLKFKDYDGNSIPRIVEFESEKFKAIIKTESYSI